MAKHIGSKPASHKANAASSGTAPSGQSTPSDPRQVQDPATTYERAKPDQESGMGRLDNNTDATPTDAPDQIADAVSNQQNPNRQINSEDVVNDRVPVKRPQPDHSMKEEEPLGWDQAPVETTPARKKRHPRTEGKGGTN